MWKLAADIGENEGGTECTPEGRAGVAGERMEKEIINNEGGEILIFGSV